MMLDTVSGSKIDECFFNHSAYLWRSLSGMKLPSSHLTSKHAKREIMLIVSLLIGTVASPMKSALDFLEPIPSSMTWSDGVEILCTSGFCTTDGPEGSVILIFLRLASSTVIRSPSSSTFMLFSDWFIFGVTSFSASPSWSQVLVHHATPLPKALALHAGTGTATTFSGSSSRSIFSKSMRASVQSLGHVALPIQTLPALRYSW